MKRLVLPFILSFLIVSLGQPQTSLLFSLLSSSIGFAIFWISLFKVKKRFFYGTTWFFLVQLVQLSWLASPTYQGTYIYFVYAGLALCLGVEFGILSLFFPRRAPIKFGRCLGIAALWTLMEWSRLHVLCGFAWNPVGLAHTALPVGSQMAAIWGVFGLSFWVMLINLLAVNMYYKREKKVYSLWGCFLMLPYLFGYFHIAYHESKKDENATPLHVALIQTALLPDQKVFFQSRREQYVSPYEQWENILFYLEEHAAKDLDLIVLPEAALPYGAHPPVYDYQDVKSTFENIWGSVDLSPLLIDPFIEERGGRTYVSNAFWSQAIADHYGAEMVIGLDDSDEKHSYNAAFHFVPNTLKITRYEKRVLLPLAEYLPFSSLRPLVARYGISHFFTHGKEAKVIEGKCPMSLSICYEECFSNMIREGRKEGAKLFVNVTNDAWYPFSSLPKQHYDHGRIRAIENGVPLVRACNTGVTAGVDSLGRTTARFEDDKGKFELERGALFVPLNLYSFPTLYTVWGDGLILIISLGCLTCLIRKRENPLAENGLSD